MGKRRRPGPPAWAPARAFGGVLALDHNSLIASQSWAVVAGVLGLAIILCIYLSYRPPK